jgi:hypothetical protein
LLQPEFYKEVIAMPRKKVIHFFGLMVVISSIVGSIADTWYLIYGKTSIPITLSAAFPGLAIHNGVLCPSDSSPYVPPSYLVSPIFNQLLKLPSMLNNEADSLIAIDTAEHSSMQLRIPMIILKARKMVVHLNERNIMEFPYEQILFGAKDFEFTSNQIAKFMKRYSIAIFFAYFFSTAINNCIMFLFSIFFLGFAAFIFRMDRKKKFHEYLKVAVYAISPIILGGMLVSIAGVKFDWIWHILIFLSTIVMFRAIVAISNLNKRSEE